MPSTRFAGKLIDVGENSNEQGAELAIHGHSGRSKIHINNQVRIVGVFKNELKFSLAFTYWSLFKNIFLVLTWSFWDNLSAFVIE